MSSVASKVPPFKVRIAPARYYPSVKASGAQRAELVTRAQIKSPQEDPFVGEIALNSIDAINDLNLAARQAGSLIGNGDGTIAYQAPALGAAALNLIYGSLGMRNAYQKVRISNIIGDKIGSLEGRVSMGKYGLLLSASIGYTFTRILHMASAIVGVEVAPQSASLLGRVAFGFGIASGILILAYTVTIASLSIWRIYQRHQFIKKLDHDQFGYERASVDEKINYLRQRVVVFSDPTSSLQQSIANYTALAANGGVRMLPMGDVHDRVAHTSETSFEKYDGFARDGAKLIELGKVWARENLRVAIQSFPEELAEIKGATDAELDQLVEQFLQLNPAAIPAHGGINTYFAELGKLAFFDHLEMKKDAKMGRILGMSNTELQSLKYQLTKEGLTQIEKQDILNKIHERVKKNDRFDSLIIGCMVLGIIGIIVGLTATGGVGILVATVFSLLFAISVLAVDGYAFYQAYKAGAVGKHDERIAKISIAIAIITFAISIGLLSTVSFGVVPLVTVTVFFLAWTTFKVTTWYLARKVRLEKEQNLRLYGPPIPPLGHRGITPMVKDVQTDIYRIFMRNKHPHAA